MIEITQSEQQNKQTKTTTTNQSLIDLWVNIKLSNIHIIRIQEEEGGIESVFEEIIAEIFPNLKKETDIRVQEAQRIPNKMNQTDPHQDIIKMTKVKERI